LKKVLIISYYFPPSGGPGVQRVLKFVKYLPQFGWEPIVLTVQDGDFPARDETLLKEIPSDIKVYRTNITEPYKYYRIITGRKKEAALDVDNINKGSGKKFSEKFAEFIRATFFIPDGRRGWLKFALKEGKKILQLEKPDVIFSSSPPYTCAMIAMKLKKYSREKMKEDIPWVSDFRDAWTDYISTPNRWFIPSMIDKRYERKTLEEANVITTVVNGIKDDFDEKYPHISQQKKYVLIRNGFDVDDFVNIKGLPKEKDKLTIVYTGSMYGKRNPYFLIDTLSGLCKDKKIDKDKIKLIFVGRCGSDILNFINSSDIKESINIISYIPHSESIEYLMKADAMLLIIDEDKYSKMIVSGKVFEYLGASLSTGKPIIAITPEGEAADLIRQTNSGFIIPHGNSELLSQTILNLYNCILGNSIKISVNKEEIKKYDRKFLTQKLAETLNQLSDN
jgi:hypothetical protein